jgi:hypothetical protein
VRTVKLAAAPLVLALILAASASAKQTRISVSTPAAAPVANVAWQVTVHVSLRGKPYAKTAYRPTVYLMHGSYEIAATFHGTRVADGTYRVRLVFPHAGRWQYVIPDPVTGDWHFVSPAVRPG